jgi:cellulose synthase/poly-beta-1,6-N-acetylglucosamine synthase-like glycosyltransferase
MSPQKVRARRPKGAAWSGLLLRIFGHDAGDQPGFNPAYEVRALTQSLQTRYRTDPSNAGLALVSVIVPTHKRLPYLTETVGAILAQSYPALELLIVADGHDQDFANFVSGLQNLRVKYLACQSAGRPSVPRNLGIAQGEYIAFCDDDDVWHRDKIQKQTA